MLNKLRNKISFYRSVSFFKYIYYNYISKTVIRKSAAKIIPYKNVVLNIDKTARIYLDGEKDLEVGINKLRGSKAETLVRVEKNAIWYCNNGGLLFYNTLLEIKENAVFTTGFFSANGGSTIIVAKKITFGEDVMMGRNIIVYDSDFHQVLNEKEEMINPDKEIIIGNHVWLTSNITILKGVNIHDGCLITAQTLVRKDVDENAMFSGGASGKTVGNVNWSRELVKNYNK